MAARFSVRSPIRHGHQSADRPEPRRRRPNGKHGIDGLHRWVPGLRRILADAGVAKLPILDWFHIGMRLQHLKQIASALSADDPAQVAAKAAIVAEVERLHWRIWNGKAKNARISIDRIRAVMHHFQGEPGSRKSIAPSRSCGPPCKRWMVISPARATGWSITPNAIVPDCELELRSPKGPPISW